MDIRYKHFKSSQSFIAFNNIRITTILNQLSLVEWRTDDKWFGKQQSMNRTNVLPEGTSDAGQKIQVRFSRLWYDAVAVESRKPRSKGDGNYVLVA